MIRIGPNEESAIQELTNVISKKLDSAGLFYRIFFRVKSPVSIEKKLSMKAEHYKSGAKKMQDAFGIRVTLYFFDDENIAINLVKRIYEELPDDHSIDGIDGERFGPQRHNLIFRVPEKLSKSISMFTHDFIDNTFEVQFRTVFSEGWHEIEHDLRYKCKDDWESETVLSRQLNGQLATLESCNWTMLKIFDELAYKKYKTSEWSSFFRNIIRIRFEDNELSDSLIFFLNQNKGIPKELLRKDREILISSIAGLTTRVPLLMDNVFFIINRYVLKDVSLGQLEPPLLKQILDNSNIE